MTPWSKLILVCALIGIGSAIPTSCFSAEQQVPFDEYERLPEVDKNAKTTVRKIKVYYVNGHREWVTEVEVTKDQVKTILSNSGGIHEFEKSRIDSEGHGAGVDDHKREWEFHGFTKP